MSRYVDGVVKATRPRARPTSRSWFPLGPPMTPAEGGVFVCWCGRGVPHEAHEGDDVFGEFWCPGWPEVPQ